MRSAALLVTLIACTKAEPPPPAVPPDPSARLPVAPSRDAGIDAPPGPVDVELVRVGFAYVRVSSRVANPKILPQHLIDRDLTTAWNSVTGDLVGAWIEISPTKGSEVHDVRLTAGFTATGPAAEDWFTMNPRIKKLTVLVDGAPSAPIVLDPENRALQKFAVRAHTTVRLEVAEIVPGTKPSWRETSVSELEVWGTPPPGFLPRSSAMPVGVGRYTDDAAHDPCAEVEKEQAEVEADNKKNACGDLGCDDHRYPPTCEDFPMTNAASLPAWATPTNSWCYVADYVYGPKTCTLVFAHRGTFATVAAEHDFQNADISADLAMQEVLAASPGRELVVRLMIRDTKRVAICRASPFMACSQSLDVPDGANLSAQLWVF